MYIVYIQKYKDTEINLKKKNYWYLIKKKKTIFRVNFK